MSFRTLQESIIIESLQFLNRFETKDYVYANNKNKTALVQILMALKEKLFTLKSDSQNLSGRSR
jgi:hypothetical protein